jgi:hypothetical protein
MVIDGGAIKEAALRAHAGCQGGLLAHLTIKVDSHLALETIALMSALTRN